MNEGKVLIGVAAGLTAGIALGILFAPDKGSNTRKKISKSGEDFMDDIKVKFDDFLESTKDKLFSAKDDAEDMMNKSWSKANDIKKEVKNSLS